MAFLTLFNRRGGSFTPDDLTGLVATVLPAESRAAGLLWQDTAKTIPATADGDPVRVAVCPYTAVEFIATGDAARPLLYDEGGGLWSLSFDGADDSFECSAVSYTGATSLYARWRETSALADSRAMRSLTVNALVCTRRTNANNIFINGMVYNSAFVADANPHTVGLQKGGGNWSARVDSVALTLVANNTDLQQIGWGAGGGIAPNETFEGRLSGFLGISAELSAGDIARVESYLAALTP